MSIRNTTLGLVKDTFPKKILITSNNKKNFDIAVEVFTEITLNSSETQKLKNLPSHKKITLIKDFVDKHAPLFWSIFPKFPFDTLNQTSSQRILEKFLRKKNTNLDLYICNEFVTSYRSFNNLKAGYHLLMLIKKVTHCDFEIPEKGSFRNDTVENVLNQFIESDKFSMNIPANFIEIFYLSKLNFYYLNPFIRGPAASKCLSLAFLKLYATSMTDWPKKNKVILTLLKNITQTKVKTLADMLSLSRCKCAKPIGKHISHALHASTLTEAIPHFYELIKYFPKFYTDDIESIFNKPFPPLLDKAVNRFIKRLFFNHSSSVFFCDEYIIGHHKSQLNLSDYLIAYNKGNERMIWGKALDEILQEKLPSPIQFRLNCQKEQNILIAEFIGSKTIYCLDASSGEIKTTIELADIQKNEDNYFYLSSNNFVYQFIKSAKSFELIGGTVCENKLNPIFRTKKDIKSDDFNLLSNHAGIFYNEKSQKKLILFNPTGNHITINCLSAKALGDQLYMIERTLPEKNCPYYTQLTLKTMKDGEEVLSSPKIKIALSSETTFIEAICENGDIILSGFNHGRKKFIFINLKTANQISTVLSPQIRYIINQATGELWYRNLDNETLYKFSLSEGRTEIGHLPNKYITNFVHISENNQIYCNF